MKLSIITINYNNCEGLRKTIESVVNQTWKDFEWIIVDGGSTDGSRELIEETAARLQSDGWHTEQFSLLGFTAEDWKNGKFTVPSKESLTLPNSPQLTLTNTPQLKWTSEKDNGIYNAMNKGIVMAQGEYLLFLNSGDILSDSDSMKRVSDTKFEGDIISFDIYVDSISRKGYRKSVDKFNSFWYCDNFLYHPSTWINKKCLVELPYHEEYKIVSDWVFFFEALVINSYLYQHVPLSFSVFYNDGISSTPMYYEKSRWERNDFLKKHFPLSYLHDKENEDSFHYLSKGVANMMNNKQRIIKYLFLLLAKINNYLGNI